MPSPSEPLRPTATIRYLSVALLALAVFGWLMSTVSAYGLRWTTDQGSQLIGAIGASRGSVRAEMSFKGEIDDVWLHTTLLFVGMPKRIQFVLGDAEIRWSNRIIKIVCPFILIISAMLPITLIAYGFRFGLRSCLIFISIIALQLAYFSR